MNTYSNNILDTIISEVNSINDKIKGLNFLEILKINLIEKLSYINFQDNTFNKIDQIEKEVTTNKIYIKISVKYLLNSSIISKKLIELESSLIKPITLLKNKEFNALTIAESFGNNKKTFRSRKRSFQLKFG